MSGTIWEPGRRMGTREGATDAPRDLADVTHEPNQFYDPSEAAADRQGGGTDSLASALAQVRQSLGEARSSTDRAIVDRLITSVEALVAVAGSTGTADQPEALAATAPPDIEE